MAKETKKNIFSYRPKKCGNIEEAVASLINEAGGVKPAASLCRVGATMLSHYANPNRKEQIPIDVVIELETGTRSQAVTHHLAAQHQAVVFQYPRMGGHRNWLVHLAHTTEKFSTVAKLGAEYLTQGELNSDQRAEIKMSLEKLMEKLAILHQALSDEDERERINDRSSKI